jgi:hypothetical protein
MEKLTGWKKEEAIGGYHEDPKHPKYILGEREIGYQFRELERL